MSWVNYMIVLIFLAGMGYFLYTLTMATPDAKDYSPGADDSS